MYRYTCAWPEVTTSSYKTHTSKIQYILYVQISLCAHILACSTYGCARSPGSITQDTIGFLLSRFSPKAAFSLLSPSFFDSRERCRHGCQIAVRQGDRWADRVKLHVPIATESLADAPAAKSIGADKLRM